MISVVVESWNVSGDPAALGGLVRTLGPELGDAELVITHAGLTEAAREQVAAAAVWVELPAGAGYYDHKNAGFAASRGEIVAFVDGDCAPAPGWLAALTEPIAAGRAQVVAGATSYPGALAPLANVLDFPYFAVGPGHVRNFFANNVAFERQVFAQRRYPELPMFHGQCQVLGLELRAAGIAIAFAPAARVVHAWPDGLGAWLATRLLRGADTRSLLPHVLARYAPRAAPIVARLGGAPALAVLGLRAAVGMWTALRHAPRARGLALVAAVTAVDAIGAAAAPAVYRALA